MGQPTRFDENGIIVLGPILGCTEFDYPALSIVDADMSNTAALSASKCEGRLHAAIEQAGTATTQTKIIRTVKGATGTLKHFTVTNITASAGASNVTVDLQINGVSALSAVVTQDAASGDLGIETGVITTPGVVAGDVVTVVVTANAVGTPALAAGIQAQLDWNEDYAL